MPKLLSALAATLWLTSCAAPPLFHFRLPDLEGQFVSSTDERFQGKVVLIDLWGTWCAPCRAMTPFVKQLHSRYASEGLEVVGIAFEKSGAKDPSELVAEYVAEHGIDYLMLYGGAAELPTDLVFQKLPLSEFDGFPTTLVLGRDGGVRAVVQGYDDRIAQRLEKAVRRALASKARS